MKNRMEKEFFLSENDKDYLEEGENKIELVRCPRGGVNCSDHRKVINKYLLASRNFHLNKDYNRSIEALKVAYAKATDLQEPTCTNCAVLFRCIVTQSLENIHDDLHKMASGLFFGNRFRSSYKFASVVLNEFKAEG
jgi:hypothetical protein